ncbi:Protein XAP5 CIRCADIAN TIMEKEEPER [Acorus gramineus]|uniref:Protein XAP5 CIRCADIAN TIMEKEEPER n=3 Tax=Magnoliopsida TaxID=3398 RepID=A0AAV9B8S7_ACOGR|nr:Protein XAP5 CIRCADIAN TIMEKEEPER [Acorus gramineus]
MAGMGDGYVGTAQDAVRIRRLEKQRESERRKIQELKNKSASSKSQSGLLQFGSGTSEALPNPPPLSIIILETAFKKETVGLVTREQYVEKRVNIRNKIEEEEKEKLQKLQQEEEELLLQKRKKRKTRGNSRLSFADEIEDGSEEEGSGNESSKFINGKLGKDPTVETSFLPDSEREAEEQAERERLARQWQREQEQIRNEPLEITYSYWDGTGHRRVIQVRKGDSIGEFLRAVQQQLAPEFREIRTTSVENLLYVKEDLIIPHVSLNSKLGNFDAALYGFIRTYSQIFFLSPYADQQHSFYELIINKARGKSGPLFHFDVHEDVRTIADATIEKDESHAGKVVERHWYEKNKHIFPASRWEPVQILADHITVLFFLPQIYDQTKKWERSNGYNLETWAFRFVLGLKIRVMEKPCSEILGGMTLGFPFLRLSLEPFDKTHQINGSAGLIIVRIVHACKPQLSSATSFEELRSFIKIKKLLRFRISSFSCIASTTSIDGENQGFPPLLRVPLPRRLPLRPRCQADPDVEVAEPADGDLGIVGDDFQDIGDGAFSPAPGIDTVCIFPKNAARVVTAGEETELLVGMNNEGESPLNIIALRATLHLPFDHHYLVQNLTVQLEFHAKTNIFFNVWHHYLVNIVSGGFDGYVCYRLASWCVNLSSLFFIFLSSKVYWDKRFHIKYGIRSVQTSADYVLDPLFLQPTMNTLSIVITHQKSSFFLSHCCIESVCLEYLSCISSPYSSGSVICLALKCIGVGVTLLLMVQKTMEWVVGWPIPWSCHVNSEFYNASVPLSAQATFPYIFAVSKFLQPGTFDLVGTIVYEIDQQPYQNVFYNGTIEVVEAGGFLSMESVFLLLLGVALLAFCGLWVYGQIQQLSKGVDHLTTIAASCNGCLVFVKRATYSPSLVEFCPISFKCLLSYVNFWLYYCLVSENGIKQLKFSSFVHLSIMLYDYVCQKTKRSQKVEVGTGTTDRSMDEWLEGTAYAQSLSNKSKKKK